MMNTNSDGSSENRHQKPIAAGETRPANGSDHAWPSRPAPAWSVPPGLLGPADGRPESASRPESAGRPPADPAPAAPAQGDPASADHADQGATEAAVTDPSPGATADHENPWPGAAPPAGWFLRTPADRPPARSTPAGRPADGPAEPGGPAAPSAPPSAVLPGQEAANGDESLTGEWFLPPALEPGESPVSWSLDKAGLNEPHAGPPSGPPSGPHAGPPSGPQPDRHPDRRR